MNKKNWQSIAHIFGMVRNQWRHMYYHYNWDFLLMTKQKLLWKRCKQEVTTYLLFLRFVKENEGVHDVCISFKIDSTLICKIFSFKSWREGDPLKNRLAEPHLKGGHKIRFLWRNKETYPKTINPVTVLIWNSNLACLE